MVQIQQAKETATSAAAPQKFMKSLGVESIVHDSGCPFLDHLQGVQRVLEGWGEKQEVCHVGLYHSIYGSELFQDFQLSMDKRDVVQGLIGDYAEKLVYIFCTMDLASLDATLSHPPGHHFLMQRKQHGGNKIPLTDQQYEDLCIVQMADWLEQVERWAQKPEEKLGWGVGDAWGHRRNGYRRMAEMLGGKYLDAYNRVFAREPEHTKHIVRDVTPEVKHQVTPIKA